MCRKTAAFLLGFSILAGGPSRGGEGHTDLFGPAAGESVAELVRQTVLEKAPRQTVLTGYDRASVAARAVARTIRQTRLTTSFKKRTVKEVLDFIRKTAKLNIVLSAKARTALAAAAPAIDLEVKRLPLADVLELITVQLGAYRFSIRPGAILLQLAEEYRPKTLLRVYRIQGIVRRRPDFIAPPLGASLRAPDE